MRRKLETRPPGTDRTFLLCMLEYALLSVTPKTPGHPTMEEVFDFLFSEARGDPEARDLERRLHRFVRELLHQPLPKKKRLL